MESEEGIINSRVKFDEPKEGISMAGELLEAFQRHAHRTLLVDVQSGREWTGRKLLDSVGRVATNLNRQVGVKADDVVLMMCDHTGEEILLALGLVLAGGAFYGSSPTDGYPEVEALCEIVQPQLIATNSRLHNIVAELKRNFSGLQNVPIVWIDNPTKSTPINGDLNGNYALDNNNNNADLNYYLDIMQKDNVYLLDDLLNGPIDETLLNQVAYESIDAKRHHLTYMLTSGSTGRPKVVPSTHEELIHGIYSMKSANKYCVGSADETKSKRAKWPLMPLDENSILAGDLPLDHGAGVNTMFLSICNGSKFIIMPAYDVDTFWQSVQDYQITSSIASTTFTYKLLCRLKSLIDSGETSKWDLSKFRYISCAGSKMAFIDLVREINKVYEHINISQCYGCTEIGFLTMLSIDDCRTHLHSTGHLFPGITAKVVDPNTSKLMGPNERGELRVLSKSKFKGYRCHPSDDPEKLVAACHDEQGFYRTGDQAHYDEDHRFYIHGRFNDTLFLMQDWKIMPVELEEVVNLHPLVEYSAVVGVPDKDLPGCDAPKAFVKLIPTESKKYRELENDDLRKRLETQDHKFIAEDVYRFVAERTAEPKHLKGGVRILNEFPRVGLLNKIDRKALLRID